MNEFEILMIFSVGLLIISLLFLVTKFYIKYKKNENKKNLIFVSIAIIALIIALIFESYLFIVIEDKYHLKFEYSVRIHSISVNYEVVYLPITEDINIIKSLEIISGKGQIDIIESEYGPCLEINFTKDIEIHGISRIPEDINNFNLTMENQTVQNQNLSKYYREWIEYWIFYKHDGSSDYNCSIEFETIYSHKSGREHYIYQGYLISGWNPYRFKNRSLLYV
jgi:hypothetical protein